MECLLQDDPERGASEYTNNYVDDMTETGLSRNNSIATLMQMTNISNKTILNMELCKACDSGNDEDVQTFLQEGAKPMPSNATEEECPVHIACKNGFYSILELLLENLEVNDELKCLQQGTLKYEQSALHVVLKQVKEISGTGEDYVKCFDNLMKYRQYFDIDAKDNEGNTALHYAVQLGDDWTITKKLVRNGACINVKNKEGINVLDRIPVNTIEDILNECIQKSSFSNKRENVNFAIKLDLNIFSHKESSDTRSESELIIALQRSLSHHHLLYHPLITTFIHIKWQKIKYVWYLNLLFNYIFFILNFFYIFYYGRHFIESGNIARNLDLNTLPLKVFIYIMWSMILVREIIQLVSFKWDYFTSFENYLEVAILMLTCIMLNTENSPAHQSISAWLVVFSTMEMILLFEKMHLLEMAIYISMFKRVTLNFLKLLILISWMVLSFGLSFYLLFHITSTHGKESSLEIVIGQNKTEIEIQNENKFATWNGAVLKTLVMSIGEIEFSDLDFEHFPLASKLLFVMFIFTVVLVGLNLLNGIAISDIQAIQHEATHYHVLDQVDCLIKFDQFNPFHKWLCLSKMWKKSQIFECCFPDKVIESIYFNKHHSNTWVSSKLWVRCKGHDDYHHIRFKIMRMKQWFIFNCSGRTEPSHNKCTDCEQLKVIPRCNRCGEEKKLCQDCQTKIQQDKHVCIFKHKYKIQPKFIKNAKQIIEESDIKERTVHRNIENFTHTKLNSITEQITNIEMQQREIIKMIMAMNNKR